MRPELWDEVKRAFDEISDSGPQDRVRLLSHLTEEVRCEVERMLISSDANASGLGGTLFPESPLVAELIRDTHTFEVGQVLLNRFEIRSFVGSGGMGEVYAAYDRKLGDVALKTLRLELTAVSSTIDGFRREVMRGRKVSHPNVCRIYDLFETDDGSAIPFFTMQLLSGETLAAAVANDGPLTEPDSLPFAIQLCQGLQAAHDAGVIHGDFKSGNIVLEGDALGGRLAKITDFGLARMAPWASDSDVPVTGAIVGTRAYLAPELLSGESPSVASDVFALGVVLFYMRTGRYPFDPDAGPEAALEQRRHPLAARDLAGRIGRRWTNTIEQCLAAAPQDRPLSAIAVMRMLTAGGEPGPMITRRRLFAAAGITGAGVLAEVLRRFPRSPSGLPSGRLKTLVEDIDCPKAPPAVARAVRDLLVLSLTASKRTDVVKRSEVQHALESSGLGAQTLHGSTARAVAARTGARIIVGGEVRSESNGYRLSIHAEEVGSNRVLLPAYAVTVNASDLSSGVSRLSGALRQSLGEQVILAQFAAGAPEQIDTERVDALEAFALGLSFYNSGEPDAALAKLTEATRLDPEFAAAYIYQAIVHYAFQHDDLALVPSEKAYRLRYKLNSHTRLYTEFLHLLLLGDMEAAHAQIKTLGQFFPDDPNLNRHVSQSFAVLEKPGIALEYARKAAQLDPDNPMNTDVYACGLVENGHAAEADQLVRAALAKSPDSPPLLFCESYVAMYRMDQPAALSILEKILRRGGRAILSHAQRIKALILAGRLEEAAQQIELELPGKQLAGEIPSIDQYRYWLGQISALRADVVTSGRQAGLLGDKDPTPPNLKVLRMAAELAWTSGQADLLAAIIAKIETVQRIHASTRSTGFLHFARALNESARSRPAEALARMRNAIALWPDLTTKSLFGELLLEQGLFAEAALSFRDVANAKAPALRFDGLNIWIRSLARLAWCLEQTHEDKAAEVYRSLFEQIWGSPTRYQFARVPANAKSSA